MQTQKLNSIEIGTDKRSVYIRAPYSHFLGEEARAKGFNWDRELRALKSAKAENKEWLQARFDAYRAQVEAAKEKAASMVACPWVKFAHKDLAKAAGGKWDSQNKVWLLDANKVDSVRAKIEETKEEKKAERAATPVVEKPASEKQKAVIRRAKDDWFDIFDGASGYGMRGPSEEQLAKMTSREASGLISAIFDDRY
jgi:hypothetical protein